MATRRSFSPEFKADAVSLVRQGRSIVDVAALSGSPPSTLDNRRRRRFGHIGQFGSTIPARACRVVSTGGSCPGECVHVASTRYHTAISQPARLDRDEVRN